MIQQKVLRKATCKSTVMLGKSCSLLNQLVRGSFTRLLYCYSLFCLQTVSAKHLLRYMTVVSAGPYRQRYCFLTHNFKHSIQLHHFAQKNTSIYTLCSYSSCLFQVVFVDVFYLPLSSIALCFHPCILCSLFNTMCTADMAV